MRQTCVILITAFLLAVWATHVSAEVLFIREGASGANTGLNPTDAWRRTSDIVWGSGAGKLGAGDKLKVCGGNYTNLNIQASGTATTNLILIEKAKATDSECTTASGWDNSYDSMVKIVKIMCNTPGNGNYVTIDGRDAYGAGMMITNNDAGFTNAAETLGAQDTYTINFNNSGAHDLTFLNLNVCGRGTDTQNFGQYINSGEPNAEGRCFSINNNTGVQATNLTIKYCTIHNMSTIGIIYGYDNVVIEYNVIKNNLVGNPNNNHPNCWVGVNDHNVYYGFNYCTNLQVESGWMLCPDSVLNPPVTNLFVFGNVWDRFKGTVARVIESQNVVNGPVYLFNNTVATNSGFVNSGNGGSWAASCASSNNATEGGQQYAFNNNQGGNKTNLTHAAFIDATNGNWRITTNSVLAGAGITPGSPFNVSPFTEDADGTTRATPPSVGAFEAVGTVVANYTITASSSPPAGGAVSGSGTFPGGSSRTVTAAQNTGFTFLDWTESNVEVSTDANYTFTLNANRTLSAHFTTNHYTISPSAGPGGNVIGGCFCPYGAAITVTAIPDTGYSFVNWTENGNQVSTHLAYGFNVTADRNLVANFTPQNYTITVSATPEAGGSANGGGSYPYASSQTVTATANGGYGFVNWTESGNEVSTSSSYTFTVSADRTLVANFSGTSYMIAVSASPGAGGSVGGGGFFTFGSSQTVTATANGGYYFVNWTEGGNQVSTSSSYTFTISGNRTLVANFSTNAPPAAPINAAVHW